MRPAGRDAGLKPGIVLTRQAGPLAAQVIHQPLGSDARTVRLSPDGSSLAFEAGAPALTTWVLEHPSFRR